MKGRVLAVTRINGENVPGVSWAKGCAMPYCLVRYWVGTGRDACMLIRKTR